LTACGPDNLTIDDVECSGSCHDGACDNRPNHCPYDYDYFLNCGTDCGERDDTFCNVDQFEPECLAAGIPLEAGQKRVVRTPDYASTCSASCDSQVHRFRIGLTHLSPLRLKVTVASPWRIASASPTCPGDGDEGQCFVSVPGITLSYVILYTEDPTAVEQNVVVEAEAIEAAQLSCP
jgi:hypothetical protein